MKRTQCESYHEPLQTFGWELVKHSWCTEFHAQWWGRGEERLKGPGTVIVIKQEELWPHLGCLSSSSGQILLREEHELLYERMCFSAERRDPEHRAGAIITGQHGIGTSFCFTSWICLFTAFGHLGLSYFAIVVLLKCLAKGQPVLYSIASGYSYLFHQHGMHIQRTAHINALQEFGLHCGIWSLVDTDEPTISSCVTDELPVYFVFAPPEFERLWPLLKGGDCRQWVMALWRDEELLRL